MTKTDTLVRKFRDLNVWRRGDERAPHKPLLVLYALGQLQEGADRLIPFDELEGPLEHLLQEFGPARGPAELGGTFPRATSVQQRPKRRGIFPSTNASLPNGATSTRSAAAMRRHPGRRG